MEQKIEIVSVVPILTQIFGDNLNKKYELHGSEIRIGRHTKCQIVVDNPNVSRTHCIISRHLEGWFIKDNGSQNGTYINGIKVGKDPGSRLQFGDIIFLGPPSASPTAFAFDDIRDSLDNLCIPRERKALPEVDELCETKDKSSVNKQPPDKEENIQVIENSSPLKAALRNVKYSSVASNNLKRVPTSPKKASSLQKIKKNKVENSSEDECYLKETQDNDSQSLLEIGSTDDVDYFSDSLNSPIKMQSPYLNNVASNSVEKKNILNTRETDYKLSQSKLAHLTEEIERLQKSKLELLKEYENMCQKNKILDQKLEEQQKLKEDLKTCEMRIKNAVKSQIMEKFEEDLICHICTEFLIKPVVLGCSHTFCEHCISEWKKKKKQCPICRDIIQNQTRVLALDHFIDQALETLTPSQKEKRKEVISLRERSKIEAEEAKNRKGFIRRRRGRGRSRHSRPVTTVRVTTPDEVEVIAEIINPESSIIITHLDNDTGSEDEVQEMFDGFGPCYRCGEYGHHHYQCEL